MDLSMAEWNLLFLYSVLAGASDALLRIGCQHKLSFLRRCVLAIPPISLFIFIGAVVAGWVFNFMPLNAMHQIVVWTLLGSVLIDFGLSCDPDECCKILRISQYH